MHALYNIQYKYIPCSENHVDSVPRLHLNLYPLVSFSVLSLGQGLGLAKTVLEVESARLLISVLPKCTNDDRYYSLVAVIWFRRESTDFRASDESVRSRNIVTCEHHTRLTTDALYITLEHTHGKDNINLIQ